MSREILLALALALAPACGESPCQRACAKLASCSAVSSESQCQTDCETPPNGGSPCDNEDAIATCIQGAPCEQLTDVTSTLQCPACD